MITETRLPEEGLAFKVILAVSFHICAPQGELHFTL